LPQKPAGVPRCPSILSQIDIVRISALRDCSRFSRSGISGDIQRPFSKEIN
jgi:hypothetical protein